MFDRVVVSCWSEDAELASQLGCAVIINERPARVGLNNRNLQRLSTSSGLRWMADQGCTHALKWRSDMLPTRLDVNLLLSLSREASEFSDYGRIVTCCFRNLSVTEDWFSSIPDLFSFGSIQAMQLLWAVDPCFSMEKDYNLPPHMEKEVGYAWTEGQSIELTGGYFCPETELYAWFRERVTEMTGRSWNHESIVRNFFRLIDHQDLGICWFGPQGFRPIERAWVHPWWSMSEWRGRRPVLVPIGYKVVHWWQWFR